LKFEETIIKKWLQNEKKIYIIHELRQKLGILVDQPKPEFGSTNDGNTARIFACNPEVRAQITGINKELNQKRNSCITDGVSNTW
jgi:hypothetical protein